MAEEHPVGVGIASNRAEAIVATHGTYRAALSYEVRQVSSEAEKLAVLVPLLEEAEGPAIVYASTIRGAELVWRRLVELGGAAELYHGRLSPRTRERAEQRFMDNEVSVMVATNALGMAIDKPDVRMALHFNMPESLEAYYQESCRAGRDGIRSRCVLLYAPSDRRTHQFFMRRRYAPPAAVLAAADALDRADAPLEVPELAARAKLSPRRAEALVSVLADAGAVRRLHDQRVEAVSQPIKARAQDLLETFDARQVAERRKLDQMIVYSQTAMCRWRNLLEYFDGESEMGRCGHCDNCAPL